MKSRRIGTARPSSLQRNLDSLDMQVPPEAWAFDIAINQ
jgi:hypothetical protein